MRNDAGWPQREVLARLVRDGHVRRSRERRQELDALLALGWIEPRPGGGTVFIPVADRLPSVRERLAFIWPDWAADVDTAVAGGADPYSAATYTRRSRTVRLELDVPALDAAQRLVLESVFEELGRADDGIRIRIRRIVGSKLVIELTDQEPGISAAAQIRIVNLEARLRLTVDRVRRQTRAMAELRRMLEEARSFVLERDEDIATFEASVLLMVAEGHGEMPAGRLDALADVARDIAEVVAGSANGVMVRATSVGLLAASKDVGAIAELAFRARDVMIALGVPMHVAVGRCVVCMRVIENGPAELAEPEGLEMARLLRLARSPDDVRATAGFAMQPGLDSARFRISPVTGSDDDDPTFLLRRLSNL